jgi:flagellar protein FlbD
VIALTRLNRHPIAINCDLIEWVEAMPDTTVRMVSGESIIVLEKPEEVIRKISDYRRKLLAAAGLAAILTSGWKPNSAYLRREETEMPERFRTVDAEEPPEHEGTTDWERPGPTGTTEAR